MKRSHIWILFGIVFLLTIPLLFYSFNMAMIQIDEQKIGCRSGIILTNADIVTNITLIFNYNSGENITFHNITLFGDTSAFNATIVSIGLENISYYSAINGVFVKGLRVNGTWYINQPTGHNWLYYVNGQLVGLSCSALKLNNNWVMQWVFKSGNPFTGDTDPNNDEFWLYTGLFLGIAIACVVGIYLIIKKGI
jgi:hypothetical protein